MPLTKKVPCALCHKPAKADNVLLVTALGLGNIAVCFCDEHYAEINIKAAMQQAKEKQREQQLQEQDANQEKILQLALAARDEPLTQEALSQEDDELREKFSAKGKERAELLDLAARWYVNALLTEYEHKERGSSADCVRGRVFRISNKKIRLDEVQRSALQMLQP